MDNYFSAFIDILGFSNMIENDIEQALEFYNNFFSVVNASSMMHKTMTNHIGETIKERKVENTIQHIEFSSFSDSIIFSSKEHQGFLWSIATIISYIISSGFLVRGGIGYGLHYEKISNGSHYIVSKAFLDAVKLESNIAKFPRILIHKDALNVILNDEAFNKFYLLHFIIQDEDNHWFLNPFFHNPDIEPIIELTKDNIYKYKDEPFHEKYLWFANLCNYFTIPGFICCNNSKYYNEKFNFGDGEFTIDNLCNTWEYQIKPRKFFYPAFYKTIFFKNMKLINEIYKNTFDENVKILKRKNLRYDEY